MRLVMTVDQPYWQTPDGAVWTRMPPAYSFFERHLRVFSSVRVLARTTKVSEPPLGVRLASGPGVKWHPVPNYSGLASFLRHGAATLEALRSWRRRGEALLLRGPSHLANCLLRVVRAEPFAVEVLGDPVGLYPNSFFHRQWFHRNLERQCRRASVTAFVSSELARRYHTRRSHRLLDIELPPEAFASRPRQRRTEPPFRIVAVGGFDHPVKGHDVLIDAVAGRKDLELVIVGDGRLRNDLESRALSAGVRASFVGQLGGSAAVRDVLRSADLFVLASRTEGKPRALVEALAAGLPSVATAVGGVPELLPADQLVPPDDTAALASTIHHTLLDQARYARLSEEGIRVARDFSLDQVIRRRTKFLEEIRQATKEWRAV